MKMHKMLALVLAILLTLAACGQREEDKLYDAAVSAQKAANAEAQSALEAEPESSEVVEPEKQLSGELKISLPAKDNVTELWASRFRKLHPDVKISFEYVVPDPTQGYPSDYTEQYTRKTVTALVGGDAPDIVNLAFVSFYKYAKTGIFEDFYELMERDSSFRKEDYYTNIFEALEDTEGHLYAMVPYFRFQFFVLNDYILYEMGTNAEDELGGSTDCQGLIDLFWKGRESGAIREETYFAPEFSKFFFEGFVIPQFLDEKNGTASFDTPEFIEYLKASDALPFENTITQGSTYPFNWPMFAPHDAFCQLMTVTTQILGQVDGIRQAGCSDPVFYEGAHGEAPFTTASLLAIPKGPNAELAWEFIKFMIEEKEFPDEIDMYEPSESMEYLAPYSFAMPIHKKNCRNLINAAYSSEAMTEKYCAYNETLNARTGSSSELMDNLKDIFISYYDNHLISAEECAKQLQDRAWIYLNE